MAKTKMVKFNVKNVKYSPFEAESYGTVEDLAYANGISLEADYNETKIYGDGQVIGILGDDKGITGTLDVTNIEDDYEIAMGRAKLITEGLASVQQRKSQKHAIYYEVEALVDGQVVTIKNWLLNCVTGKPSESYEQTQDDPTINTYEYSLTVMGDDLMDNTGTSIYKDANGNTQKVYKVTSYPEDTGYDTFEDTVPEPTATV